MDHQLRQFFSSPAYAVVGVSANREKWGNIAYRILREKGFRIYPVNPHLSSVEGDQCYHTVADLPADVESVILVVPPAVTEEVVRQCIVRGVSGIWMQPGAESAEAIALAEENGIAVIVDACIMVLLAPVKAQEQLEEWLEKAAGAY